MVVSGRRTYPVWEWLSYFLIATNPEILSCGWRAVKGSFLHILLVNSVDHGHISVFLYLYDTYWKFLPGFYKW
jgi:hypothetical protein